MTTLTMVSPYWAKVGQRMGQGGGPGLSMSKDIFLRSRAFKNPTINILRVFTCRQKCHTGSSTSFQGGIQDRNREPLKLEEKLKRPNKIKWIQYRNQEPLKLKESEKGPTKVNWVEDRNQELERILFVSFFWSFFGDPLFWCLFLVTLFYLQCLLQQVSICLTQGRTTLPLHPNKQ